MTFTENKRAVLKPQKEKRLSTFILALLTAAAFFVPYMIMAEGYFTETVIIVFLIAALAYWRHRANIGRLLRGCENKIGSGKKKEN